MVTGLENSTYVQIKSGLKEGDIVYYTEQETGFSFGNMGFGSMPGGNSGGMPSFGGSGEMPDFGSGSFPGGERPSGGGRPDFGGGDFSGGFGG